MKPRASDPHRSISQRGGRWVSGISFDGGGGDALVLSAGYSSPLGSEGLRPRRDKMSQERSARGRNQSTTDIYRLEWNIQNVVPGYNPNPNRRDDKPEVMTVAVIKYDSSKKNPNVRDDTDIVVPKRLLGSTEVNAANLKLASLFNQILECRNNYMEAKTNSVHGKERSKEIMKYSRLFNNLRDCIATKQENV